MVTSCDVVVLGLGPGGEAAASALARAGLDVVGVDERLVGGECPYFGCIPSKMAIRAADALAEARRVQGLAGTAEVRPDWTPVADRIRDEATDDWDDAVAVERLERSGARFVRGHGRLAGPRTVEVAGERYAAQKGVLLNTGTAPAVPPIPGLADTPLWTNREILRRRTLPASLAVIGGGAIGVELAQAIARFGTTVTVLEAAEHLLPPEEPEAGRLIADVLVEEGVRVHAGVKVESVAHDGAGFVLGTSVGDVAAERLLVAAGRRPNLADIGLETVGLDPQARAVDVDERMRVLGDDGAVEGLWAIGDITGKGAFTHMSMYQSEVAAAAISGVDFPPADYRAVSRVTFTDPEVGSVGLTRARAQQQGLAVRAGTADLGTSSRGWIARARGLITLVADAERDVLVGATVVGPAGGEILSMLTLAIQAEVPLETLRRMHYAYPTFHRAVLDALADLG